MSQASMTPDEVSEMVRRNVAEANEAAREIDPETTDPADLERLIRDQEQAVADAADRVAILGNAHRVDLIRETARLAELKALLRAVLARLEKEREAARGELRDEYIELAGKAGDAAMREAVDKIADGLKPAVDAFFAALDAMDDLFRTRDGARQGMINIARQLGDPPPTFATPDVFRRQLTRTLTKHVQQNAGNRERMEGVFEMFPSSKAVW